MNLQFDKTIKISEKELLSNLCEELSYHDHMIQINFIMKLLKFSYIDSYNNPVFDKYVDVDRAESLLQELIYQLMKAWSSDKEKKNYYAKLYDIVCNIEDK